MNNYHLSRVNSKSLLTSLWLALSLGLCVVAIDFFTKDWVQTHLVNMHFAPPHYPYGGIGIFKDFLGIEFSLVHETNRGAAWGVLADYHLYLFLVRILLVLALIVYTLFFNKHPSWRIPLSLIIAGAMGNILDFFLYDHVVDMFRFVLWGYTYPVFNVADSAIFVGIVWLFFASWRYDKA